MNITEENGSGAIVVGGKEGGISAEQGFGRTGKAQEAHYSTEGT